MNFVPKNLRRIASTLVVLGITVSSTTSVPANARPMSASIAVDRHPEAIHADEFNAPVRVWQPAAPPRAIAIVVHGITANADCLQTLASVLTKDNVLTYGVDLRGHGWWYQHTKEQMPGHDCDYSASVRDVDSLVMRVRSQHPHLPIFVMGESVGAAVALRSATDCGNSINGVILCAPGNRCAPANPLWVIQDALKAAVGKAIDLTRYQIKYGTEDAVALQQMESDQSIRSIFSAKELLGTVRFIHKNKKIAQQLNPQTPVLVMQGEADKTIKPKSGRKFFAALPVVRKSFVGIPNCGHVLLATPRLKRSVADSIVGFINQESSASAVAATSTSDKM